MSKKQGGFVQRERAAAVRSKAEYCRLAIVCAWKAHVVAKGSDLILEVKVLWRRVGEAVKQAARACEVTQCLK
jgi:hypothetical protein